MGADIVIRPRWYRNLPLGLCLLSIMLSGLVLFTAATDTRAWRWVGVVLSLWLVFFWARVALRTWVRCDGHGVRAERPMSKLKANVPWDEVARFVSTAGVVKAEVGSDEPVVILDPSDDSRWIADRLEHERARRQHAPSA